MLFKAEILRAIRSGKVTLAFGRWSRPTVRQGGTLLTAVGEVEIAAVRRVTLKSISAQDAQRAGSDSRAALIQDLTTRKEGNFYRIELGQLRPDPRIALRQTVAEGVALDELQGRLQRMDARAGGSGWTTRFLQLIAEHPGLRAADLCVLVGQSKDVFKVNVRKLKKLGLTESLEVGYRLSPRGAALLRR